MRAELCGLHSEAPMPEEARRAVKHEVRWRDPVHMRSMAMRRALVFGAVLVLAGATLIVAGMIHPQARDQRLPFAAQ